MNILDTIDSARQAFEIAGRNCLVRIGEDQQHDATVAEIAARLEPHPFRTGTMRRQSRQKSPARGPSGSSNMP
jgi:hypothetical protein